VSEAQDVVLYEEIGDHIAIVTLNRPEKRNAVNAAMAQAMDACVKRTEADPDIFVVILTSSSETAFGAGADLAEAAAGRVAALHTPDGGFGGLTESKRTKPWIAAVNGFAVAGGMEFCLACDLIVAGENARFGLPEAKRSMLACAGGVNRLPKLIPRAVALELIATGEPIDARRAYEVGLVNRVVPVDQVLETAKALARSIAANAPIAVREALQAAKQSQTLSDEDALRVSREAFGRVRVTEDFKEGPRAFVEKRPPVWQGR
jgi:enoyl-CoA hydratase